MHVHDDLNTSIRVPIPGMPAMSEDVESETLAVYALNRRPSMVTVVTEGFAM